MALLGPCVMSDLSPQSGPKQTFESAHAHLAICECTAYIPDMSCDDSKRARHRQRQAAYEARRPRLVSRFTRSPWGCRDRCAGGPWVGWLPPEQQTCRPATDLAPEGGRID
jgi:hypothetical protein